MFLLLAAGSALVDATAQRELQLLNIASPEYAETSSGSGTDSSHDEPGRTCAKPSSKCCCLGVAITAIGAASCGVLYNMNKASNANEWYLCPYDYVCPSITVKGETFYNDLVEPLAKLSVLKGTVVPLTGAGETARVNCASPMMWGIYKDYNAIYQRCCGPNSSVPIPPVNGTDYLTGNVTELKVKWSYDNSGNQIVFQRENKFNGDWIRVTKPNGCANPEKCAWAGRRLNSTDLSIEDEEKDGEEVEGSDDPATRRMRGTTGRRRRRRVARAKYCNSTKSYQYKGSAATIEV